MMSDKHPSDINGSSTQNGHSNSTSPDYCNMSHLPPVRIVNGEARHHIDGGEQGGGDHDNPEDDPWNAPDLVDDSPKWATLDGKQKFLRVFFGIVKGLALVGFFYVFVCSLHFLSSAFRLIGGKGAGKAMSNSELMQNPVAGLMIGVLVTVLVQSSSTSTSIVVSMVASKIINVTVAIPIIMGANIGTSITNTIVSLAQAGNRNEFRRAFAAATILDMFNWLTVLILLPLEAATHYLHRLTEVIIKSMEGNSTSTEHIEFFEVITHPFTDVIIQLNTPLIEKIARGIDVKESLVKRWCKTGTAEREVNATHTVFFNNASDCEMIANHTNLICQDKGNHTFIVTWIITEMRNVTINLERCHHIFAKSTLGDTIIGVILLLMSLFLLCFCLISIVKILHTLMKGNTAKLIKKVVNASFPKPFGWLTGYIAILVGTGLTFLVQSSSIFTSTLTPLVGIGVITLKRMYPLTLGANIGTTATAIMAAMTSSGASFYVALQIAFCHLFFNITGIIIWYPIPFLRRIPIKLSKVLGNTTAKYRWFAIVYLIGMFLILPALVFGVSLGGWPAWAGVFGPLGLIMIFVIILNILQRYLPSYIPKALRTWNFLPLWLHSLEPYDKPMVALGEWFGKLKSCSWCKKRKTEWIPQTNLAMKNSTETL